MNTWRLVLAPHKCAQITFSRARSMLDDRLSVSLYGHQIPYEKTPKFLGIIFDSKLSFEAHFQHIKKKVGDRINLLKILSYDRTWRLDEKLLVKIYKSLVCSVLDYASVCTGAMKDCKVLEILQNNALRVIFKKTLLDKVSCEELRNKAGVSTVFERHAKLANEYYERALLSQNPLINSVFSNYKKFKERGFVKLTLLDKVAESGRDRLKSLIDKYNKNIINKKEKYTTTLCNAKLHVRQMILDNYDIG